MGYKIEIVNDESPESPREWDNLGTMYCFHRRYSLGDKHNLSIEEVKEISESPDYISLPLYLYDHGGITMKRSPFSCPWDSGQVGIIAVSKKEIREEYRCKLVTQKIRDLVLRNLRGEVETYDQFLTGDVWGYVIRDESGDIVDSCWGYYGQAYAMEEAQNAVKYLVKENGDQIEMFA